jgi:tetratricopeptide (TPR) repeat protein
MDRSPLTVTASALRHGLAAACALAAAVATLAANETPAGKVVPETPAVPTAATAHAKEPARAPTPASTPPVPADVAINPALRQTTEALVNSNIVGTAHDQEVQADPMREFQTLLELGRQQRGEKNFTQAKRNFVALLEGRAPDPLKRAALLELATLAQEDNELGRAQQLYAQYLRRWPDDSSVPEVYLRQGLLFRQMGAPVMALAKFYAVMTSALTLKSGNVDYYQKLVLHAQTEIADTYYLQGKYADAAEFFRRLIKLDAHELKKQPVQFKLIRCLVALGEHEPAIAEAQDYLARYRKADDQPEIRFLLATALRQSGRKADALKHVLLLLEAQQATAAEDRSRWIYWQRRAGNEIGNQLYEEGDYLNALMVYSALAGLDTSSAWQLPVWYQMGLICERLHQPQKAAELYGRVIARQKELDSGASPGLKTVLDMARWRMEVLNWQTQTERSGQTNAQAATLAPRSAKR